MSPDQVGGGQGDASMEEHKEDREKGKESSKESSKECIAPRRTGSNVPLLGPAVSILACSFHLVHPIRSA